MQHLETPDYKAIDLHQITLAEPLPLMSDAESLAYNQGIEELQANSFADQFKNYARWKAIELFGNAKIKTQLRVLCMTQIKPNGGINA